LFYAHPHPGPLPRGEGETVAAFWQKGSTLIHECNVRFSLGVHGMMRLASIIVSFYENSKPRQI
jgi:hypothetical protein